MTARPVGTTEAPLADTEPQGDTREVLREDTVSPVDTAFRAGTTAACQAGMGPPPEDTKAVCAS